MKRKRLALAGTILALTVLSGCGMARDGYIEDTPAAPRPTTAPMESPYISASPMPSERPSTDRDTEKESVRETPMPEQNQDRETE